MKISQIFIRKLVAYSLLVCMVVQLTSSVTAQAGNSTEVPYATKIVASDIESGKDYIFAGSDITCSDHGTGQYAISSVSNGNADPKLLSHVPFASYEDITNDIIWTVEEYGNGYSLQSKAAGETVSGIANTEFRTTNTTANGYTMTDTEDGLQITGKSWVYAMHTLATPISGADIDTVTVRFKVSGGESAIMKFYSGSQFFYVNLSDKTEGLFVNKTTDADGFTLVTLDFQDFSMDSGDTWSRDTRSTNNLTAIGLCCNNATGAPTFDYVAYNVGKDANEDADDASTVEFTTTNTTAAGYTMTDTENGLQITGKAWVYAMHTIATPISGGDIDTVTVRFKVTGGESAIMRFYSGSEYIYVNLSGTTDSVVSKSTDADGFTILTLNFQTMSNSADTWSTDTRATKELTAIGLCCNNATGAPTFDYVAFNTGDNSGEDVSNGSTLELTASNTTANGYTMTDTANGLQITGKAWTYAMHTLATPISGGDIDTVTVRFKVTGGESAIMRFYSGGEYIYVNLSGTTDSVVSKSTDADGFTILTLNFQTMSDSANTWSTDTRATKDLTAIGLCCNNASGAPTFDYVAINGGDTSDEDANGGTTGDAASENSYMNIAVRGGNPQLELGPKQELKFTYAEDGTMMISATVEGTEYFVRFTGGNGIGWQASTGTNTRDLNVFEISTMDTDVEEPREEPLYTIAAFTDMHIDYGIEDLDDVIRSKTQEALDLIKEKENPDMVLVGGDTLSGNAGGSALADKAWEQSTHNKVAAQVQAAFKEVSKEGKVLYVNGNHDYEPGYINYNSGAYIDEIMKADTGAYTDVLYESAERMNNLLAYYYDMDSIHYIGLNTMYDGDSKVGPIYSEEQTEWLDEKLQTIDPEEPIIVLGHYPFRDSKGMTANYGMAEETHNRMKEVLIKYPNVLYLYGHDHGSTTAYVQADTFERVTAFNSDGSYATRRTDASDSFKSCFMGSLSFYKNTYNEGWLSAEQPKVVQALMIYIYSDRIDLQMKNYGEETGARQHIYSWSYSRGFEIASDNYTIDQEAGIVTDIAHQTSIEDFLAGFDHADQLEIYGVDGNQITDTSRKVRSGMVLKRNKDGAYVDELEIHVNLAAVSDLPYTVQNLEVENNVITSMQVLANTDTPEKAVGFVGLYDADGNMLKHTWTQIEGSGTYPISLSIEELPEGGTYRAVVYDSMTTAKPQSYLLTSDDERYTTNLIATSADTEMVAGIDQQNKQIVVYNQNSETWDEEAVVWKWKPSLAKGFKSYNLFASPYANPSDAKLRYSDFYGGYVVVTTSSSGFVGVIDYETGECLFERNSNSSGENNPHAIELLPDGNVVVASSAGNSVTVYAATTGDGNGYYKRYTLRDAHGLVWDPALKVLWALGYDELVAYEIGTDASEPVLTAKEGMTYTTPEIGGHDLYTVYGDSNLLWVTVHENIYQFDKTTGTFATCEVLSDVQTLNVKSIGTQPFSGDIVCLIPNGAYALWDSDVVDWFAHDGNGQYTKESRQSAGAYYKARAWYYKYQ